MVETFRVPLRVRLVIAMLLAVFAGLGVLCMVQPLMELPWAGTRFVQLVGAILFGGAAASFGIYLPWLRDTYELSEEGITWVQRGWPVTVRWKDVTGLIESPDASCLELHAQGPEGPIVFRLRSGLGRYNRLRELVMERTDWLRLAAFPDGTALTLPLTIYRPVGYFLAMPLVALISLGVAVLFASAEQWLLAGVAVAFALATSLRWYAIDIAAEFIRLRRPLWPQVIPVACIRDVRLDLMNEHGASCSDVVVDWTGGRPVRLYGARGGGLRLFAALQMARHQAGQISEPDLQTPSQ
ncbi:hypothetical protein [Aquisphaera giovannonii]|nr:hypothetical protein [Aquisphaera giovannonii]